MKYEPSVGVARRGIVILMVVSAALAAVAFVLTQHWMWIALYAPILAFLAVAAWKVGAPGKLAAIELDDEGVTTRGQTVPWSAMAAAWPDRNWAFGVKLANGKKIRLPIVGQPRAAQKAMTAEFKKRLGTRFVSSFKQPA